MIGLQRMPESGCATEGIGVDGQRASFGVYHAQKGRDTEHLRRPCLIYGYLDIIWVSAG